MRTPCATPVTLEIAAILPLSLRKGEGWGKGCATATFGITPFPGRRQQSSTLGLTSVRCAGRICVWQPGNKWLTNPNRESSLGAAVLLN